MVVIDSYKTENDEKIPDLYSCLLQRLSFTISIGSEKGIVMHYLVITTGSCGNCYIFSTGKDTIIIDDGVTYKKITEKMAEHEMDINTVRGLFLTHLHPDHSKGVGVLQRKLGIPVFISSLSKEKNESIMLKQKIEMDDVLTYEYGESI